MIDCCMISQSYLLDKNVEEEVYQYIDRELLEKDNEFNFHLPWDVSRQSFTYACTKALVRIKSDRPDKKVNLIVNVSFDLNAEDPVFKKWLAKDIAEKGSVYDKIVSVPNAMKNFQSPLPNTMRHLIGKSQYVLFYWYEILQKPTDRKLLSAEGKKKMIVPFMREETERQLLQYAGELPEPLRTALLKEREGYPRKAIAEELGITEHRVKRIAWHARYQIMTKCFTKNMLENW